MSPLLTGPNSVRKNVQELMGKVQSSSRLKAINTIAKKNNISRSEAQFRQALKISERMARK